MTIATSLVHRDKTAQGWLNVVDVAFSGTYAAGGDAVSPEDFFLGNRIIYAQPVLGSTFSGYGGWPIYNPSTEKLELRGHTSWSILQWDYDDMTDNTDATGHIDMPAIPGSAIVSHWYCVASTGFTGDSSATIQVGVSGDLDRFSAHTTGSVFTNNANVASLPLAADAADGFGLIGNITPRITITSGSDFTSVSAGSAILALYYRDAGGGLLEHPAAPITPATYRMLVLGV